MDVLIKLRIEMESCMNYLLRYGNEYHGALTYELQWKERAEEWLCVLLANVM
jgi:hypothetical protein